MTIKDFRARPLLLTGTYIHSTPVVGCRSRSCAVAVGRSRTSLPRDREAVVPCTFHTLDLVVPPQRHGQVKVLCRYIRDSLVYYGTGTSISQYSTPRLQVLVHRISGLSATSTVRMAEYELTREQPGQHVTPRLHLRPNCRKL